VDQVHVETPLESARTPFSYPAGSSRSEITTAEARLPRARRVVPSASFEARAARRLDPAQEVHERRSPDCGRASRPSLGDPLASTPTPTRSRFTSATKPSAAAIRTAHSSLVGDRSHRGGGVDDQCRPEVLLVDEELDVQAVEAAVDVQST